MTKHLPDEVSSKLHLSLEEAEKLLSDNVEFLDGNGLLHICNSHTRVKPVPEVDAKPVTVKARTELSPSKSKLGKNVTKLYNLEQDQTPEKTLNVEFDVDLYQMENY
ncbi:MAG: hypothetical protein NWF00_02460 [Candidatus Bathyarchaeota archaeon]|nr:hypothetical protein [Candidatus Bathyarchaeota archaeon]